MADSPLDGIREIYDESVREADKQGYADAYKKCAELFCENVNKEYALKENPVHFSDIEYLDGYFIFGHGTNSVVHFHVDECQGWKFGIWWNKREGDNDAFTGEFFAQFEETIDKFKPSRSEICGSIQVNIDSSMSYSCRVGELIRFIRDEPYLAFCRDYNGWDYNTKYHSREEAEAEYRKYREYRENKVKYTSMMDEKILQYVTDRVLPVFHNAEIIDRGSSWSPRYDVVAPFSDNTDIVGEPGLYDWFDKEDEEGQEILAGYKALLDEAQGYADKYEFFYFRPIHNLIMFYEDKTDISYG